MKCPKCKGRLVYEEFVNGIYTYQFRDGLVDWGSGDFSGECLGHRIRCTNCEFEQQVSETNRILDKSVR